MSAEKYLVSPDIMTTSMAVIALTVGAVAVSLGSTENVAGSMRRHENAQALERLLNILPIDITTPRYDLPRPKYVDVIMNHANKRPYPTRRWGNYFPGGY